MSIDQENIWGLIGKKLSGEATASELTQLEQLLRANPDLHYSVQPLMDLWQTDNSKDKTTGREAFSRHIQRMEDLGVDFSSIDIDPFTRPASHPEKSHSPRRRYRPPSARPRPHRRSPVVLYKQPTAAAKNCGRQATDPGPQRDLDPQWIQDLPPSPRRNKGLAKRRQQTDL